MLTSDLLRVRVSGATLKPTWIDPDKKSTLARATSLVDAFEAGMDAGCTRGELDQTVADLCAEKRDHKLVKGLAKLLFDGVEFGVDCPVEPRELRQLAFRTARQVGPLALEAGPLERPTAGHVFQALSEQLGVPPAALERALYGDLKESQTLKRCDLPTPQALLQRYNVALVQACLLKAADMTLTLESPRPERVRQLFRWIKFHQLIHRCQRTERTLIVHLDGPTSLFKQSSRYGLQFASFLPAVLLLDTPWTLSATVLWTKANHKKTLQIDHTQGLVSTRSDTGAWKSKVHDHFEGRWAKAKTDWVRHDAIEPINLGPHGLIMPDYRFSRNGTDAYLEIIGFWRKDYLERRLAHLKNYPQANLVLAVSKRLLGSKTGLTDLPATVVPYAEVLPVKKVVGALDALTSAS